MSNALKLEFKVKPHLWVVTVEEFELGDEVARDAVPLQKGEELLVKATARVECVLLLLRRHVIRVLELQQSKDQISLGLPFNRFQSKRNRNQL